MRNLLEFLQRHYNWFLFVGLEVISLVLLFQYNSYQGSVWFSTANAVAGKFYQWNSAVQSYFSLKEANQSLAVRNYYLERQVTQLRRLYAEKADTLTAQEQLGMALLGQYEIIPAKVISNETDRPDNLMTIDRGLADGVREGMGVACGNGVVGVTYLTSQHYSVVIPILNRNSSRISCAIRGSGYFGVLRWHGEEAGYAYLEDIPRHARLKRGDWVETNGYSSMFPPGILVGKVVKAFNSPDGLSYQLKIHLSTDFGNLRDVFVLSDKSIGERMRLMQIARDSLELNVKD